MSRRLVLCALAAGVALLVARPGVASRATCEQILQDLDAGKSGEDVMREYRTTKARLEVCTRLARQVEDVAERRDRFELRRAERGLPH